MGGFGGVGDSGAWDGDNLYNILYAFMDGRTFGFWCAGRHYTTDENIPLLFVILCTCERSEDKIVCLSCHTKLQEFFAVLNNVVYVIFCDQVYMLSVNSY